MSPPHGAGLSNCVFSDQAFILEASEAFGLGQSFFKELSQCCGHSYKRLKALPKPSPAQVKSAHSNEHDMKILPDVLRQALTEILR